MNEWKTSTQVNSFAIFVRWIQINLTNERDNFCTEIWSNQRKTAVVDTRNPVHTQGTDISQLSSPCIRWTGLWGRKRRTMKAAVPPTKKRAMRMKQMRSMTAAATIQSFIIFWFSSSSWRWRADVRALILSRSRMSASRCSTSLATGPSVSDSPAGRRFLAEIRGESRSRASISVSFSLFPLTDLQHPHLTQSSVARYWHTSFLNCSHNTNR